MKPDISVRPGRFRIGSVDVIRATKSLLVLEADCNSKYPGDCQVWSAFGDHGPEVIIWPGERSLRLDEGTDEQTVITLPAYADDWVILAEGTRYTVRIVAYDPGGRRRPAWRAKEEGKAGSEDAALQG